MWVTKISVGFGNPKPFETWFMIDVGFVFLDCAITLIPSTRIVWFPWVHMCKYYIIQSLKFKLLNNLNGRCLQP